MRVAAQAGVLVTELVQQQIRLHSARDLDARVPPTALGEVLRLLEPAVRKSVRMAFEGRSTAQGRRPGWLRASADIRLAHVEFEQRSTTLLFESPRFGDAAPSLYEQTEMFPTGLPNAQYTGFDMLAGVLSRIGQADADSDRYDRALLGGIATFDKGLNGTFQSIELMQTRAHATQFLDGSLTERARELRNRTPSPRPVRLLATLDMLRVSTGSLGLKLDDGTEVRGAISEDGLSTAQEFLGTQVLVHGRAVYRASGRLLRVDVDAIESGEGVPTLWARVPEPIRASLTPQQLSATGPQTGGVAAFFGRWPGDETEDELVASLQEL